MAALAGGNIRVGLEDNSGSSGRAGDQRPAGRARRDDPPRMGCRILGPAEVREKLKLRKRW
jgi:uncharacterized protein (DUF849 family)